MAGRASIVGAAATHVGKVREHNEDAHFLDTDRGMFLVCDGMGGHAAGEVASALAIQTIRGEWAKDTTRKTADTWLERGTPDARKQLFASIRGGVLAAHAAILSEGAKDEAKSGMGTTLVGAMIVGNELVFAHAGDSRAYLVRDGIAMQLTEDHTLLARLLAAGIDVDVSGEGARFRSMLTNALGIGRECKVATFVVPLADGDRFLLCSDGISEYVPEAEVGAVLTRQPTPARAAQRLVELALDRGGGDNATAVVVRVVEAGETPLPVEQRKRDDAAIEQCPLWGAKVTPQQRLRALRVGIPRDHAPDDRLPAHTLGDRVAWIIVEGQLVQDGRPLGPGALVYPESLISDGPLPERDALAAARTDVRALALRADDFRELCEDDSELGEALLEALAPLVGRRGGRITQEDIRSPSESELAPGPDGESREEPTSPEPKPGKRPSGPISRVTGPERASSPRVPMPAQSVIAAPIVTSRISRPRISPRVDGRAATPAHGVRPVTTSRGSKPAPAPAPAPASERRDDPPPRPRATPVPSPLVRSSGLEDGAPIERFLDRRRSTAMDRLATEPEIEAIYELEAEPPPLAIGGPDRSDDDIEEMTVSVEDGRGHVIETVTDDGLQTLTLTMTAPSGDEEPTRVRAITADDATSVSGMISSNDPPPPDPPSQRTRTRRQSDS